MLQKGETEADYQEGRPLLVAEEREMKLMRLMQMRTAGGGRLQVLVAKFEYVIRL